MAGALNGTDGESEPESRSEIVEVKYQYEGIYTPAVAICDDALHPSRGDTDEPVSNSTGLKNQVTWARIRQSGGSLDGSI